MNSQKWIKVWLTITIIMPAVYAGAMIYLDPLQLFHKTSFSNNLIYRDTLKHNAGIINNYYFDSIILGTSSLDNTSSKEASRLLASNFVNLSINGANLADRAYTLEHALNKKNIKNIIFSLDLFNKVGEYRATPTDSYSFLYNDNPYDDIKAYFNLKYLLVAGCRINTNYFEFCSNKFKNIENLNEWFSRKETSERFGGLNNWIKAANKNQSKDALKQIIKKSQCIKNGNCIENTVDINSLFAYIYANESFDSYVFKYAQLNPKTNFHLVFPPYSRLKYAMWKQANTGEFDRYISAIKYIVKKSQLLGNISVYGFDHLLFVDNISNYVDTVHYHPKINSMMLRSIRDKKNILTVQTVDIYIETIKTQAQIYNINNISDKIKLGLTLIN